MLVGVLLSNIKQMGFSLRYVNLTPKLYLHDVVPIPIND